MITASKGWSTGGGGGNSSTQVRYELPLTGEIKETQKLEGELIDVIELTGEFRYGN